jgi:hypothetical protein
MASIILGDTPILTRGMNQALDGFFGKGRVTRFDYCQVAKRVIGIHFFRSPKIPGTGEKTVRQSDRKLASYNYSVA